MSKLKIYLLWIAKGKNIFFSNGIDYQNRGHKMKHTWQVQFASKSRFESNFPLRKHRVMHVLSVKERTFLKDGNQIFSNDVV